VTLTDNGWADSARAWIDHVDGENAKRRLLLDPVMLRLSGDVSGLRVLDAGCGEGRFSRMLAERGADVAGVDVTREMAIEAARRAGSGQSYAIAMAERLPLADETFDVAVSYVMLVDVIDYRGAIAEMARVLRPGGRIVVANVGFVSASPGWERDADGRRLYHRIDRYLEERPFDIDSSGIRITNWHRPLSAYMRAYLSQGLLLREFLEPAPETDDLRDDPATEDWYRVPDFNVMLWEKPHGG
jgi:2-polyprenyl-3-methyl-5-hydroxy-6-metoxy-1,4-benzoquinol methylase